MTAITCTARKIKDAAQAKSQCAILPVFSRKKLSLAAQQLDDAAGGAIKAALALGDFTGKAGETCMLAGVAGNKRLLLVGCGDQGGFDRAAARVLANTMHVWAGNSQGLMVARPHPSGERGRSPDGLEVCSHVVGGAVSRNGWGTQRIEKVALSLKWKGRSLRRKRLSTNLQKDSLVSRI